MRAVGRRIYVGIDGRGVFGIAMSALAVFWAALSPFASVWITAALLVGLTAFRIWKRGGERLEDEELRREYEWCQTMELPHGLPGRERRDASQPVQGSAAGPQPHRHDE